MICYFVLVPIAIFGFAYAEMAPLELPAFDMDRLITVLLGTLELGGLGTAEKLKGVKKMMHFAKYSRAQKSLQE